MRSLTIVFLAAASIALAACEHTATQTPGTSTPDTRPRDAYGCIIGPTQAKCDAIAQAGGKEPPIGND